MDLVNSVPRIMSDFSASELFEGQAVVPIDHPPIFHHLHILHWPTFTDAVADFPHSIKRSMCVFENKSKWQTCHIYVVLILFLDFPSKMQITRQ